MRFRTLNKYGIFLYSRVSQNSVYQLHWDLLQCPFCFQRMWIMGHACWRWKWEAEVKAWEGWRFLQCSHGSNHGKWGQSPPGPWSHTDALFRGGTEVPVKRAPWPVFDTNCHNSKSSLTLITRERIKKYLLSYVIQLSKSYTILFLLPTFQLHRRFRTTIKTGRQTLEAKTSQQIWVTKLEKHQTFGKRTHGWVGGSFILCTLSMTKQNEVPNILGGNYRVERPW